MTSVSMFCVLFLWNKVVCYYITLFCIFHHVLHLFLSVNLVTVRQFPFTFWQKGASSESCRFVVKHSAKKNKKFYDANIFSCKSQIFMTVFYYSALCSMAYYYFYQHSLTIHMCTCACLRRHAHIHACACPHTHMCMHLSLFLNDVLFLNLEEFLF